MALLSALLGEKNPLSQWAGRNSNALTAIGSSLLSRGMDFSQVPAAAAMDKDRLEAANTKNATLDLFRREAPDLAAAVEAGLPIAAAYGEYMRLKQPKAPTDPSSTATGRQQLAAQYGLTGADATSYILTGKLPDAARGGMEPPRVETRFNPQTGLEEKVTWNAQTNQWDPFGGQKAPRGANDLSATETKQLFETEDNILSAQNAISALDQALALNDKSRSGFGSDILSSVGVNVPDWMRMGNSREYDTNTLLLKNIVTEGALSQLKMIFGSAPTEGERKILLEIQGSVDQPADVRQRIYERAKELALKRLEFNQQRKAKIEGGGYGQAMPADGSSPAMRGNGWTVVGVE